MVYVTLCCEPLNEQNSLLANSNKPKLQHNLPFTQKNKIND